LIVVDAPELTSGARLIRGETREADFNEVRDLKLRGVRSVAAIKHPDLANAIDRMYEAAAYPDLWPEALGSFANSLGGFGGSIVGFSAGEKLISYVSPESAEIAAAYARGGWAEHNFRIQLGAPLMRRGRSFIHERMVLDRLAIDRQRIQNEFLNAFQMRSFIAFEFVPGEIGGCVERGMAEVEDWEISELERASHHLKRIGAIASARGAMFALGIETGLDHLRAGAILLDRRGRIVSMNARAASIRDRVFAIQSGQLSPRDTEMAGAFGRMLQGVSAADHAHEIGPDAAIRLRCADGSSFLARAAPLVGPAIDVFMRARILLLLTPLQSTGFESVDRLRSVFGLTHAEARLAGRLAAGDDIASAAVRLGVSQGTVRGALKAIFRKTGAKRQAELVGLLTRIDI
jgi:DNA-binding CsgD family transcriptional regulator